MTVGIYLVSSGSSSSLESSSLSVSTTEGTFPSVLKNNIFIYIYRERERDFYARIFIEIGKKYTPKSII